MGRPGIESFLTFAAATMLFEVRRASEVEQLLQTKRSHNVRSVAEVDSRIHRKYMELLFLDTKGNIRNGLD